jgi:hypothetical protein
MSDSFIVVIPHVVAISQVVFQFLIVVDVADFLVEPYRLLELFEEVVAISESDLGFEVSGIAFKSSLEIFLCFRRTVGFVEDVAY